MNNTVRTTRLRKASDGERGRWGYTKQYQVHIVKKVTTGAYVVVVYWGRSEQSIYSCQSKTITQTPSLALAEAAYREAVEAKISKGYELVREVVA